MLKLLIPDRHPAEVLRAVAFAQTDASQCVLLLDAAQLALAENSAVPLQVQLWELEAALNPGAFAVPLRLRNRQRVSELKEAGFDQCIFFGDSATVPEPVRRVAKRLQIELSVPPMVAASPDSAPGLSAHAHALAKVANRFRQVPPHASAFYRAVWVLPQSLAKALGAEENTTQLRLWINGLAQRKCYLYVVVLADEGHLPKRALFSGTSAFQTAVETCGAAYLGRYQPETAADCVVGAIAHADILFFNEVWVGCVGEGLGKTLLNLELDGEASLANRNAAGSTDESTVCFNALQALERVTERLPFLL